MPDGKILKGYIVPGLPHLVFGEEVGSWAELGRAYRTAGENARKEKPDVLVIFSTQWISVLGHLFQADPNPKGLHVDENWYYMGEFPFDFKVDTELAKKAIEVAGSMGLQVRPVNYDGFPVDTGTLVTLHFFNPENTIPVCCISCNIYAGRDDELALGRATAEAIRQTGRRAVVIACSGLSGRFFTSDIDAKGDRISKEQDDQWNRKLLDLMAQGRNDEAMELVPEYAKQTSADMMFKAFYWLMGALGTPGLPGKILAYGPLWGTGAAVVEYEPQA